MSTMSLPDHPNLDHLRHQARALQRAVRAGDRDALARVTRQRSGTDPMGHSDVDDFGLAAAQLVVAREYGFASWPRLRHYLDIVAEHGWQSPAPADPSGDAATEFCRLVCSTYTGEDGPERWAEAGRLLAEHPELTATHIWAAAAAAEPTTVERLLDEDPARARLRGGPCGWRPLFYLAYSRLDPAPPLDAVRAVARRLLDAGADPNEGYLWNALPTPFTVLTGVFGEGELGPERQPRHPHSLALARLLLDAGADPNDGQTLYNRMFSPGNDHLELLFEYGLGGGDGGPWKARLGDLIDSPAAALRVQLRWAVEHHMPDRVRLLARHGVDVRSRYDSGRAVAWLPVDGRSPADLAALNGDVEIVDVLMSQGAAPPALEPPAELIAAAFRGDRATVDRLRTAYPDAVARARQARPGLIVWAAARGNLDTVALLADLGFDVNARGRGDAPVEGGWETALHQAAAQGNLDLARLLLSLGADPDAADARFAATPLGWARHLGQQPMADYLAPLTRE